MAALEIVYGRPRISSRELGDIIWSSNATQQEKIQALHDYQWGPTPQAKVEAWHALPLSQKYPKKEGEISRWR